MESKNIKVIDEHGIDRDANIICGFIFDGTKYVLYSIERDEESDNLFVSKVRDNLDKTSSMESIEVGKEKINEIVRELVTYSIKNEEDKTTNYISLPNGENIEITNVLFNKEQNIVVPKTYVSTVKKSVTKVSEKFYKIDKQNEDLDKTTVFETLSSDEIVSEPEMEHEDPESINLVEPVVTPEVSETLDINDTKESEMEPISAEETVLEPITTVPVEEPKPEVVAPSFVVPPVEPLNEIDNQPELEVPETLLEPSAPVSLQPEINKEAEVTPEPILPVEPIAPVPGIPSEPVKVETSVTDEPKLFFDGTDENNLNKALDEVSEEKVVSAPQAGVESLREFGVDEPTVAPTTPPAQEVPVPENVKKLTRSKGFANNKFFMVIAIAFFLAACVFLGYEAFQYFTLK